MDYFINFSLKKNKKQMKKKKRIKKKKTKKVNILIIIFYIKETLKHNFIFYFRFKLEMKIHLFVLTKKKYWKIQLLK